MIFSSTSLQFVLGTIIYIQFEPTCSLYIEGTLNQVENWAFLTRFCFLSNLGKLHYTFTFPTMYDPQDLLLYYDDATQWPAVYKTGMPCQEAISPPHIIQENNQDIKLTASMKWSGCNTTTDPISSMAVVVCEATRSFASARERWWYLAISRCYNTTLPGIYVKYQIHMTNGDDLFRREFSADEFSILEVDIAFLCALIVILILAIISSDYLKKRQLFHTSYKMYLTSLSLEVFALFIACIAYGKYANDGLNNYGLKTFGRVADVVSILVFILMLLLLGKGFTVTRGRISTGGSIKIAIFMTLYVITYAVLFFYDASYSDPGLVLYIYESPPGYGIIALRVVAWLYFSYACFFTLKHYPEKKKFYYPFYLFYTVWFLIGPIFVLIGYFAWPKYMRAKVVNGIDAGITFLAQTYLLFLTRPSNSNKNFPFHVRTSQIGILSAAAKEDDNWDFNQHPYSPSAYEYGGPDFTALFNVARTVYAQDGKVISNDSRSTNARTADNNGTPSHEKKDPFVTTSTGLQREKLEENGIRSSIVDRPSTAVRSSIVDRPSTGVRSSIVDRPSTDVRSSIVDRPSTGVKSSIVDRPSTGLRSSTVEQPPTYDNYGNDFGADDYAPKSTKAKREKLEDSPVRSPTPDPPPFYDKIKDPFVTNSTVSRREKLEPLPPVRSLGANQSSIYDNADDDPFAPTITKKKTKKKRRDDTEQS